MAGTNWQDIFAAAFEDGAGPKYLTMARILREAISDGRLEPGVRLLPVRELAWQLKITPGTVAREWTGDLPAADSAAPAPASKTEVQVRKPMGTMNH